MLTGRLDFSGRLRLVPESYLTEEGCPCVEEVAALTGTSSRTLRRRLEREGLTYSGLVDQVRFDVVMRLLNDPGSRMMDIAYALGYSDPSHFSRSFRRMTGVSPSTYRRDRCSLATSGRD